MRRWSSRPVELRSGTGQPQLEEEGKILFLRNSFIQNIVKVDLFATETVLKVGVIYGLKGETQQTQNVPPNVSRLLGSQFF